MVKRRNGRSFCRMSHRRKGLKEASGRKKDAWGVVLTAPKVNILPVVRCLYLLHIYVPDIFLITVQELPVVLTGIKQGFYMAGLAFAVGNEFAKFFVFP